MSTVLVTGANRGIGLELVRALVARGDHVIAACRAPSDALGAVEGVEHVPLDVTDDQSLCDLAGAMQGRSIDVLINNAGVLSHQTLDHLDIPAMRHQFEVNALGPLRVTHALLPHLAEGAKVAIVTSRMGSIADNGSGGAYGYRMSKAAVNAAGRSLALDLKPRGVAVVLLHPGYVQTDMTGGRGHVTPDVSAAGLLDRIDELTLESTGTFRHMSGEALPW